MVLRHSLKMLEQPHRCHHPDKYEILTTPQRYESETAKACQTCWIVSDPILVCLEPHDIMFDLISYLISYVMSFLHTSRMQSFVTLSIMEKLGLCSCSETCVVSPSCCTLHRSMRDSPKWCIHPHALKQPETGLYI